MDITDDLTVIGGGAGTTIIDASGFGDRVFHVHNGVTAHFQLLTLTGANTASNGGAIFNDGGDTRLLETTLSYNTANVGGAVFNVAGTLIVTDSLLLGNSARVGGGVYATSGGTITLTGSDVIENTASVGNGGGILNNGSAFSIVTSTISANTAEFAGGGIKSSGGSLTITNSGISDNIAGSEGGGIHVGGGIVTVNNSTVSGNAALGGGGGEGGGGIENEGGGTVTITDSTISENTATSPTASGGINNQATMTIINSTISRNTATFSGGIKQGGGTLTITHSTITANTALSQAGGLRNGGTVNLFNTILADNNSPDGPDGRNFGTINSQGHNLIGNNSGFVFTPGAGDLVGTSTSPIDPQLGPLQDNGGSNFTHAFVGCSPAIDAGDNTAAPATDQRGFTRIVDGDGDSIATIDIGAFEAVLGNCANQPPVANDDAADTDEDTPVVIDVVANDVDDDANLDSTTVTVTIGPSNGGTVVNTTTGEVTYSPAPDFNGSDSFVYEVCDTEGLCDTATVSITVNAVNGR